MSYSFENSIDFEVTQLIFWFWVFNIKSLISKQLLSFFFLCQIESGPYNFECLRAENPNKIQAILLKSYIELDLVQLKSCLFKFLTLFALAFKKVNPLVVKRLILALTSVTFESLEYLCVVLSLLMKNMERTGGTLPTIDD